MSSILNQLQATLPSQVPRRPEDRDQAIDWAKKWGSKLSKFWSPEARTWVVRWCVDHQSIFRTKSISQWASDLRIAINIELQRDNATPQRLLGPSGKWVKDHIAFRDGQALETGPVQTNSDYLQAMDEWVEVCARSTHTTTGTREAREVLDMDRALGNIIAEDMMLRQDSRLTGTESPQDISSGDEVINIDDIPALSLPNQVSVRQRKRLSSTPPSSVLSGKRGKYSANSQWQEGLVSAVSGLGPALNTAVGNLCDRMEKIADTSNTIINQRMKTLEEGQKEILYEIQEGQKEILYEIQEGQKKIRHEIQEGQRQIQNMILQLMQQQAIEHN